MNEPKKYGVELEFTEDLLASSPCDPNVYKEFIAAKAREAADGNEEIETLDVKQREENGWSVFHADEGGLFLFDYHIKGFLKEACASVIGNKAQGGIGTYKGKIDRLLFISPRRIYITDAAGLPVTKPDGILERPIRMLTAQGPRVALKRSDLVSPGRRLKFTLTILPLAQSEFTEKRIAACFDYGEFLGMGEWRSGSNGRFHATVCNLES